MDRQIDAVNTLFPVDNGRLPKIVIHIAKVTYQKCFPADKICESILVLLHTLITCIFFGTILCLLTLWDNIQDTHKCTLR